MLDIETTVFTRVKNPVTKRLKDKYPDLTFTTSSRTPDTPKFPTVYIHLMPAVEMGRDLDGTTINGGMFTFQIEVSDSQSQTRAKAVMDEVVAEMKNMRFELVAFPENQDTNEVYRNVARFRRIIGALDKL